MKVRVSVCVVKERCKFDLVEVENSEFSWCV